MYHVTCSDILAHRQTPSKSHNQSKNMVVGYFRCLIFRYGATTHSLCKSVRRNKTTQCDILDRWVVCYPEFWIYHGFVRNKRFVSAIFIRFHLAIAPCILDFFSSVDDKPNRCLLTTSFPRPRKKIKSKENRNKEQIGKKKDPRILFHRYILPTGHITIHLRPLFPTLCGRGLSLVAAEIVA